MNEYTPRYLIFTSDLFERKSYLVLGFIATFDKFITTDFTFSTTKNIFSTKKRLYFSKILKIVLNGSYCVIPNRLDDTSVPFYIVDGIA